jgi:addiction module HigA family antidote
MTLKSPTTTKRTRIPEKIAPVHPGEILREDILTPLGMSVNKLALSLGVPAQRMGEVVNGKRAISPDTALRLARFLGTTPEFWIRLGRRSLSDAHPPSSCRETPSGVSTERRFRSQAHNVNCDLDMRIL